MDQSWKKQFACKYKCLKKRPAHGDESRPSFFCAFRGYVLTPLGMRL